MATNRIFNLDQSSLSALNMRADNDTYVAPSTLEKDEPTSFNDTYTGLSTRDEDRMQPNRSILDDIMENQGPAWLAHKNAA